MLAYIVKVGSTDGHVEGRRGNAIYSQSALSDGLERRIRATRRPIVSSRDDHRDSLGGGLLPERVVKLIAGGPQCSLTKAKTVADDISDVVVHEVLRGEVGAMRSQRRFGDNEFDCGAGRDHTCYLYVKIGFQFVAAYIQAGILSVHNNVRGRETG